MGDGIRIFFMNRGKFPEFLTRYLLQGMAGVLGAQELKITKAELHAYFEENGEMLQYLYYRQLNGFPRPGDRLFMQTESGDLSLQQRFKGIYLQPNQKGICHYVIRVVPMWSEDPEIMAYYDFLNAYQLIRIPSV